MPSTPGTVNYPTALDDSVSLIDAGNLATTTLASTFLTADTTAHLTDASLFPASGTFSVESEIVYYTGKATNDLTGCVRAQEGTTAVDHAGGLTVQELVTARHHTVLRDAIIAAETELGVGARMSRIYNQRGGAARAVVLPAGSFSSDEVVALGSGTLEVPATGTLILNDAGQIPAKILQGGIRNVVRDYGATAWPDAAPQIQRAIDDAASDGGGIVEVPPAGTAPKSAGIVWHYYNVSQIQMRSNVWLRGQGIGSQLRYTSSGNTFPYMIVPADAAVVNSGITDMALFSDGGGVAGGIGFDTGTAGPGDCRNFLFNLYVFGFAGHGIYFNGAWRAMEFLNIYMTNCGILAGTGGNGFRLDQNATDNVIEGIHVGLSGNAGIVDNSANNRYVACKAFLSGQVNIAQGDGFQLLGSAAQLMRCESQQNLNHGYNLSSLMSTLIGCLSDSCAGNAFNLASVGRSYVQGYAVQNAGPAVGPHANIVNFSGTLDPNIVDVIYDPPALIAGGLPIAGYTGADSKNEVRVRKFRQNATPRAGAFDIVQRPIDLWEDVLLPTSSDFSVNERLSIGATNSFEIPATSSLTIYNVS